MLSDYFKSRVPSHRDVLVIDAMLMGQSRDGTMIGVRDFAMFRWMVGGALSRDEIAEVVVGDTPPKCAKIAVSKWLRLRGSGGIKMMFHRVDRNFDLWKLTGESIRHACIRWCRDSGVELFQPCGLKQYSEAANLIGLWDYLNPIGSLAIPRDVALAL